DDLNRKEPSYKSTQAVMNDEASNRSRPTSETDEPEPASQSSLLMNYSQNEINLVSIISDGFVESMDVAPFLTHEKWKSTALLILSFILLGNLCLLKQRKEELKGPEPKKDTLEQLIEEEHRWEAKDKNLLEEIVKPLASQTKNTMSKSK
ncbi:15251_t:CDS:2, partial [Gigaspora rosea]